jgi:hypothetical protein
LNRVREPFRFFARGGELARQRLPRVVLTFRPEFVERHGDCGLDDPRLQDIRFERGEHLGVDRVHAPDQAVATRLRPAFPVGGARVEQHALLAVAPTVRGEPAAALRAPGEP